MQAYHRKRYALRISQLLFQPLYWGAILLATRHIPLQILHLVGLVSLHALCNSGWSVGHYRLSRRVGLSHQRATDWVVDLSKRLVINIALGSLALGGLYFLISRLPNTWWLAATFATFVLTLGGTYIAPVLLMPIFNRFTPLADEELKEILLRLAAKTKTQVLGIFVMDMGRRTKAANAMLTGTWHTKRIILADTLLDNFTKDEIEVILAHELAHYYYNHIWRGIVISALVAALFFYATALIISPTDSLKGVLQLQWMMTLLSLCGLPLLNAFSRYQERQCDRFALHHTQKPQAFVSAMEKLAQQNMADNRPHPVIKALLFSHPPLDERLAMAKNIV